MSYQVAQVIPVVVGPIVSVAPSDAKGTFTFSPLEAHFNKDKDLVGKMDPYCKIKLGHHSAKSAVARHEGKNPHWHDTIVLERKHHEHFAKLKVKDRDRFSMNDRLGKTKIPLDEIAAKGSVLQWFNVYKMGKVTGEVLMKVEFRPAH